MKKNSLISSACILLAVTMLSSSCQKESSMTSEPSLRKANPREGMVYLISNNAGTNTVMSYEQHPNGQLSFVGSTMSGGAGSASGLGSQDALIISGDKQWMFAVNAGSNSISSFQIASDGSLTLAHTVSSNGTVPISLTMHQNYLYVVNGGSDNISGFMIGAGGTMTWINGSTQPLSQANAGAAQISFRPDGQYLYVTEKATNRITSYPVNGSGVAGVPVWTASAGQTPFGFDFSGNNYLVVSEAFGGGANASTVSSYNALHPVTVASGAVPNGETAACWVETTKDGKYAFVTNTGSNSISAYSVGANGMLHLDAAAAATTGGGPLDIKLDKNEFYMFTLDGASHTISIFRRPNGSKLMNVGTVTGLPQFAAGLATL